MSASQQQTDVLAQGSQMHPSISQIHTHCRTVNCQNECKPNLDMCLSCERRIKEHTRKNALRLGIQEDFILRRCLECENDCLPYSTGCLSCETRAKQEARNLATDNSIPRFLHHRPCTRFSECGNYCRLNCTTDLCLPCMKREGYRLCFETPCLDNDSRGRSRPTWVAKFHAHCRCGNALDDYDHLCHECGR